MQPGPANDYLRDYGRTDTISGISTRAPGTAIKGFLVQDNMANETQNPIEDRSREHLGAHDTVLSAMRVIYLLSIEALRSGRDPKHILREAARNDVYTVGGTEELERL